MNVKVINKKTYKWWNEESVIETLNEHSENQLLRITLGTEVYLKDIQEFDLLARALIEEQLQEMLDEFFDIVKNAIAQRPS